MHRWISPMEKSIFLVPVWISPFEKSKLVQKVLISQLGKSIYARKTKCAPFSSFPKVEGPSGGCGIAVGWGLGHGVWGWGIDPQGGGLPLSCNPRLVG